MRLGKLVKVDEAATLLFLAREVSSIPVPRLLNVETCEDDTVIIEMELIPGEKLSTLWPNLSHVGKMEIASRLHEILVTLRTLTGSHIGSVGQGPACDLRRTVAYGGPFSCEADFNNWLVENVIPKAPGIYRRMVRQAMCDDHRIVLTHGDIRPDNVLVRNGAIVGVLDWELAGYYPEYWDFVQTFRAMDRGLDFHDYIEAMFPQLYPHELMTNSFLGRMTRH